MMYLTAALASLGQHLVEVQQVLCEQVAIYVEYSLSSPFMSNQSPAVREHVVLSWRYQCHLQVIWEASVTLDGEQYGWAKDSYKGTAVQRACEQALQRLEARTGSNNSATSSDDEGPQPETVSGSASAQSSAQAVFNTPLKELSALSQLILRFEADTGLFSKGRTLGKSQ